MDASSYPPALRQYLEEVARARAEFGDDVIVVYHNGKFFDVYGSGEGPLGLGCDVALVGRVCNTMPFRRTSNDAFWQCGLRSEAIEEKAAQLVDAGLTVVRMDQTAATRLGGAAGLQYDRVRTRVYSPGAPPDVCAGRGSDAHGGDAASQQQQQQQRGSLLAVVLLDRSGKLGYACADVFTGRAFISELRDEEALLRVSVRDAPREVILVQLAPRQPAGQTPKCDDAQRRLCAAATAVFAGQGAKVRVHAADPVTLTREHMEETLRRVFRSDREAGGGDCLARPGDAEAVLNAPGMPAACAAFVQLLHALYRRDPRAIEDMAVPEKISDGDRLVLRSDALEQLDVPRSSVLACRTALGRRCLRARLAAPSNSAAVIEARLRRVDGLHADPELVAASAALKALNGFPDLERLERRMATGSAVPGDWALLLRACDAVVAAVRAVDACWEGAAALEDNARGLAARAAALVCPDALQRLSTDRACAPFFAAGVFPELETLEFSRAASTAAIDDLLEALNGAAGCVPRGAGAKEKQEKGLAFRLETVGGETLILTTEKRLKACQRELQKREFWLRREGGEAVRVRGADLRAARVGARFALQCGSQCASGEDPVARELARRGALEARIEAETRAAHLECCRRFHAFCAAAMRETADAVAELDIAASGAIAARRAGRCRPAVRFDGAAGVRARALGHPAFDVIDGAEAYVPNDFELGAGCPTTSRGLLIYGANGSGKSCYMKSAGVAVVMAQAGLYVAAESFEIGPFDSLFTRFPRGDDMFRGRSTYVNEMKEVQYMLECATDRWLVIGDELCSGTNHIGGTAVVAAGLHCLHERGCCFVFATHMLNVAKHVAGLDGVDVRHFTVDVERGAGRAGRGVRYGRRMAPGPGDVNYAVEVCGGLGFPVDFMERAWRFNRAESGVAACGLDYITGTKASRYNAKVFVDRCARCGAAAEHTHHVRPQALFLKAATTARHRRHNLEVLCAPCHRAEHKEDSAIPLGPRVLAVDAAVEEAQLLGVVLDVEHLVGLRALARAAGVGARHV